MVVTMKPVDTEALEAIVRSGPMVLRLFANDRIPDCDDKFGDYTEPKFPGYKPIELDKDAWIVRFGYASYRQVSFACTGFAGKEKVYGWYLTRPNSQAPRHAERFSQSFIFVDDGDEVAISPKVPGLMDEEEE